MPKRRKIDSPLGASADKGLQDPRGSPADASSSAPIGGRAAPANITGVIGASQTGKGVYCKARLRTPTRGPVVIWSPLERTNDFAGFIHGVTVTGIPALVRELSRDPAARVVYVPAPEKISLQFDYFCRVVAELNGARVVVDELSRVTSPSWAPYHWKNLSTAGAHDRLELIGTAQQPSMIDKAFLSNCTEIRCYRLVWEEDARRMASLLQVPWLDLANLPDFHYRHRVIRECRTELGIQELDFLQRLA